MLCLDILARLYSVIIGQHTDLLAIRDMFEEAVALRPEHAKTCADGQRVYNVTCHMLWSHIANPESMDLDTSSYIEGVDPTPEVVSRRPRVSLPEIVGYTACLPVLAVPRVIGMLIFWHEHEHMLFASIIVLTMAATQCRIRSSPAVVHQDPKPQL